MACSTIWFWTAIHSELYYTFIAVTQFWILTVCPPRLELEIKIKYNLKFKCLEVISPIQVFGNSFCNSNAFKYFEVILQFTCCEIIRELHNSVYNSSISCCKLRTDLLSVPFVSYKVTEFLKTMTTIKIYIDFPTYQAFFSISIARLS